MAEMTATTSLELKQQQHERKSLKHKSKTNKRPSPTATSQVGSGTTTTGGGCCSGDHHHHHHHHGHRTGKGSTAVGGAGEEEKMRELLTSKIAELQVGGEENLETPIDVTGIYQDETLPTRMASALQSVLEDDAMSAEAKLTELAAQLKQACDDVKLLQAKIGETNARCIVLRQRKHAVSSEVIKINATKAKLEQLCRELQKQNKLIVSESRRIADEEDKKRRDLSTQFQKTIEEVSAKMDQQGKDYVASLKENENLQQKLKGFLEQYAAREEHFKRQLEAKDLTIQLAEAKLQHQVELTSREAERAKLTMEKAKEFAEREVQLQAQLNAYSEKFDVVQETLSKSNEMFTTFRAEMDKTAKNTKRLEKENAALKKKCDEYDRGAIAAIQEKVKTAEETQKLQDKIKKLESLCRQLQADRKNATA